MNPDIQREIKSVMNNAQTVAAAGLPKVKMLQLVSNGKGTGFSRGEWQSLQEDFKTQQGNSQLQYIETSHYLHDYKPEEVATAIRSFLAENLTVYMQ